jgi:hypothetical protein
VTGYRFPSSVGSSASVMTARVKVCVAKSSNSLHGVNRASLSMPLWVTSGS